MINLFNGYLIIIDKINALLDTSKVLDGLTLQLRIYTIVLIEKDDTNNLYIF